MYVQSHVDRNQELTTSSRDGEAIVVNKRGSSVFDLLRYHQHDSAAVLCAFRPN
jgi:hypothetical protein